MKNINIIEKTEKYTRLVGNIRIDEDKAGQMLQFVNKNFSNYVIEHDIEVKRGSRRDIRDDSTD
jgi:hypothetical protein